MLLNKEVEKRPTTGELLCDGVVGDYVLEMYELQVNCVSEKEMYLKDEEIKRVKEEKNEEIERMKEEKDEEIKRVKEEKNEEIKKIKNEKNELKIKKEEQEVYNANLRKEIINFQQEIAQLCNTDDLVAVSEIEFIEPSDGVIIQGKTIMFTEYWKDRTIFINKIINSGIIRMFTSLYL
jgi:predicted phage tail protein